MARSNQTDNGVDELRDSATRIRDDVRDMGNQVRDAAEEKYTELRDKAAEQYEKGRRRAHDLEEQLESCIRDNPLTSLLVAAGVGAVIGFLWRRG